MIGLLARKGTQALISLLAVTVLVFMIVRLTGDPLVLVMPETASPEDIERARARFGLDQPVISQFFIYLSQIVVGDFGTSLRAIGTPVIDLIAARLPATILLGLVALFLTVAIGVPLGIYAAYWRGGRLDRVTRALAAIGQSAPPFWVGLILILIFAVGLRLLPAAGNAGLSSWVMPAITVALPGVAGIIRLTRTSLLEVLQADYVKFARVKGIPESEVLWKHALRNAGLSILTYGGVLAAGLITGSVVVETVFAWPGLGQLMIQSIQARDFPSIQAIVLVYCAIYIVVNLTVDVLYALVDPRLRHERGA